MLDVYVKQGRRLERVAGATEIPPGAVWIDMLRPTPDEETLVEQALGIDVPTHAEMQEIEASSRLYQDNGSLFMTATVLSRTDTEEPAARPITFVLMPDRLITVRHSEPRSFELFCTRCQKPGADEDAPGVLTGLLDAVIDRAADTLERLSVEMDALSVKVFLPRAARRQSEIEYQDVLREIGRKGELNAKIQESLLSIGRLATYLGQATMDGRASKDVRGRIKTLGRDVTSLTDHAHFLADRVTFLLDATLGMISNEQNTIIKIVSIATLVFLPPTVIASIYGMNFHFMPELDWPWGYPFALSLMATSAVLPYLVFRRIGWL